MLPAIVLILWANLVALLGASGAAVCCIRDKKLRDNAAMTLIVIGLISFLPATWQTFEVWNRASLPLPSLSDY